MAALTSAGGGSGESEERASMDGTLLVRLFGYRGAFLTGDPLVYDRWRWLKKRLPATRNGETLLDVGCGSGAFTIAASLRGYEALGLSWDRRNQEVAARRADLVGCTKAAFSIQDVRTLDKAPLLSGGYDVALCLENIEHIIDDRKLMRDIFASLRPGGMLLLTTPNHFYRAITRTDEGPFTKVENGDHVRRGYTSAMLQELCSDAGFSVIEIGSCSGFFSQKITWLMRTLRPAVLSWAVTFPLRLLPPLFDRAIARLAGWPDFSLCLVASKPRFAATAARPAGASEPSRVAAQAPVGVGAGVLS